jgi:NADH dehydrogenase (ubiquinone) 1 alpha subcomplex subunit 8
MSGSTVRVPYSHELYAMSRHIVFRCEKDHKAVIECKAKHDWPEDCEPESQALVRATNKL